MSRRLADKTALITGGSRGIGRAVALAFAREGAALIGVHYAANADAADATVREIEGLGVKAVAVKADLRQGKDAADSLWARFSEAAHVETGSNRSRHSREQCRYRARTAIDADERSRVR
ncbi:UNVERIFIED_ORG: NAD(P)-dependent dehydrogenase (short-subunit alcohol dehydrogenase family) [Rhizobium sp. SORGH_AS 755]|nr:NAD(P)-dependent dehydrogenase (short-subunit alcohol dehydrogenase family) [Rhizobium sp. SORGH_AS_0755]